MIPVIRFTDSKLQQGEYPLKKKERLASNGASLFIAPTADNVRD